MCTDVAALLYHQTSCSSLVTSSFQGLDVFCVQGIWGFLSTCKSIVLSTMTIVRFVCAVQEHQQSTWLCKNLAGKCCSLSVLQEVLSQNTGTCSYFLYAPCELPVSLLILRIWEERVLAYSVINIYQIRKPKPNYQWK